MISLSGDRPSANTAFLEVLEDGSREPVLRMANSGSYLLSGLHLQLEIWAHQLTSSPAATGLSTG
jgi:hypothetical protein